MGCQVEIADKILEHKADFLLALKGNQPTLEAEAELTSAPPRRDELVTQNHGRERPRPHRDPLLYRLATSSIGSTADQSYPGQPRFQDINTLVKILNRTESPTDAPSTPASTFPPRRSTSNGSPPAPRGHWGVESMHWLLDVEFKDDLSRYRAGHGAKNMATVRRFALGLVRANKTKGKRQNPPKISRMEYGLPPRNPANEMTVNLESIPVIQPAVIAAVKGLPDGIDDENRDMILFGAAGHNIRVYNTAASPSDLKGQDPGQLHDNLIDYITGEASAHSDYLFDIACVNL